MAGGVVRLPQQLTLKRALELALTGDGVDALTAQQWGLVNKVVPAEQVLDARSVSPHGLRATPRSPFLYPTGIAVRRTGTAPTCYGVS
ncbi:enoyl-CoA hydratase-related protein [Frankia sp. Cpl3]|nr:enoyl-CoA hydratase-related protein [Parafrankia colletiae]MCK9904937.1 enoyl-CoA hydratase-related protein [Frankia sp. Cpl3]